MGDRNPKCFVPECKHTVGVLFPKNLETKQKWLKALGLEDLHPNPKSFVCLDHFEENGQPGIRKKRISSIPHSEPKNAAPTSSVSALQQKTNAVRKVQVTKLDKANLQSPNVYNKKMNSSSMQRNVDGMEERALGEAFARYDMTCRLCMVQASNVTENVFAKLDEKRTIAEAITLCLYPLTVSPDDNLSKNICPNCIRTLKGYCIFHEICTAMDAKQRQGVTPEQNDHSDGNYADSEHSDEYLHEERLSDYEEDKENKKVFRKETGNGQVVKSPSVEMEHSSNEKGILDKVAKLSSISIKKKYNRDKEELLKVLESKDDIEFSKVDKSKPKEVNKYEAINESIDESYYDTTADDNENFPLDDPSQTHEGDYTEDIIIEMVNDESSRPASPVDTSRLPITIKRVERRSREKKTPKRKLSNSHSDSAKKNVTMIKSNNKNEVVIFPSGISVERKEPYVSPLGTFKSEPLKYVFDSEYLLAGDYLYEFRLVKDNIRRLHCIVNKCAGAAHQAKLGPKEYSEDIEIVTPHNHEIPDKLERKRQMFFHILYHKMRRDKHFNFRVLYDQFCQLDKNLSEILPLHHVIKEICKQGPAPIPPLLRSFDQFYNFIESDDFHKIHFTNNHVQFYQDRFETNDGAKAVIFGNPEVIDAYSYSKLMYVDASFVIESDDFPFHLVTVLLWIDQSYYPVLYALVNVKSQEIFKKIFSYLYNTLAPDLRPHEVITDYEANLYYALGETYGESSIGGSMFYFTENIYKKICALDLARELEINSNFRNIYNMILMLPLLPVNTIQDGLNNIEIQAKDLDLEHLTKELFVHVRNEWISKVTPELFCVHRLESRINENIVAPFKKLRDLIMLSKNKSTKTQLPTTIISTLQLIVELEAFLRETYSSSSRKSFAKDLSSSQKKFILKAWNYIENHPMININQFFLKVLGYIKCMENQLWIWGFYRYAKKDQDILIDANNFSIINYENIEVKYQEQHEDEPMEEEMHQAGQNTDPDQDTEEVQSEIIEEYYIEEGGAIRKVEKRRVAANYVEGLVDESERVESQHESNEKEEPPAIVMNAVLDENGSFVLQEKTPAPSSQTANITNYVYK